VHKNDATAALKLENGHISTRPPISLDLEAKYVAGPEPRDLFWIFY